MLSSQEEFKEQIADYKEKYGEDMNFYVPVKTLFGALDLWRDLVLCLSLLQW